LDESTNGALYRYQIDERCVLVAGWQGSPASGPGWPGLGSAHVCNEAAHELAKLGNMCIEGEEIVLDPLPDCVHVIVANDMLADE
jgi:hypothetical protein